MPIAAPAEQMNSHQQSRSDDYDNDDHSETLNTKSPDRGERDDCCSSGKCEDDKTQLVTNKPDCCRGKVGPCCDMSCLDRLAMRECEVNAATVLSSGTQTNSK